MIFGLVYKWMDMPVSWAVITGYGYDTVLIGIGDHARRSVDGPESL